MADCCCGNRFPTAIPRWARASMIRVPAAQIKVLAMRGIDQPVENGVLENGPPGAIGGRVALHPRVGKVDPRRRNLSRRRLIVGPHFETVMHVLAQADASRTGQHDGSQRQPNDKSGSYGESTVVDDRSPSLGAIRIDVHTVWNSGRRETRGGKRHRGAWQWPQRKVGHLIFRPFGKFVMSQTAAAAGTLRLKRTSDSVRPRPDPQTPAQPAQSTRRC